MTGGASAARPAPAKRDRSVNKKKKAGILLSGNTTYNKPEDGPDQKIVPRQTCFLAYNIQCLPYKIKCGISKTGDFYAESDSAAVKIRDEFG